MLNLPRALFALSATLCLCGLSAGAQQQSATPAAPAQGDAAQVIPVLPAPVPAGGAKDYPTSPAQVDGAQAQPAAPELRGAQVYPAQPAPGQAVVLPTTAPDDALGDMRVAPLTATVSTNALSGTGKASGHTVHVEVVNSGTQAVILDGDGASFAGAPKGKTALDVDQLVRPPRAVDMPGDLGVVGTSYASLGTVNVAADLVHKVNAKGPAYYGRDQNRRQTAERLMGQRVLFAGEKTTADLVFSNSVKPGQSLTIPVRSHPDGASLGNLQIDLAAGN